MGSSSTNQNTTSNTNSSTSGTTSSTPGWAPQLSALENLFGQSGGALTQAQSYTAPTGTSASGILGSNDTVGSSGGALSSNGSAATASGLGALSSFNPSATNNPQAIVDAANKYASGQNIQAQTDAAMQQAKETVRDVTLPGISQGAAMTGNTNSSRTGIAEGLVNRSLAENAQNTYNSLYSTAYQNGLNLAQTQAQNNNTGALSAANAAATAGTSAANAGTSAVSNAINNVGNANNVDQTNYTNSVNNAYAALQDYMKLVGSNNWGSTTTTSGTSSTSGTGTSETISNPSALQMISGLLGAAGQGLGMFGGGGAPVLSTGAAGDYVYPQFR